MSSPDSKPELNPSSQKTTDVSLGKNMNRREFIQAAAAMLWGGQKALNATVSDLDKLVVAGSRALLVPGIPDHSEAKLIGPQGPGVPLPLLDTPTSQYRLESGLVIPHTAPIRETGSLISNRFQDHEVRRNPSLVRSAYPIWPVELTRQWLPVFEHVANRWGIHQFKSTFEPYNIWNIYDELEAREFGPRGHSREYAEYFENYLWNASQQDGVIDRNEESWGMCYEMKKVAAIWHAPALGGREINGLQIDERGLLHLIAAAGTHIAKTNVRNDQAGILDRLAQFVDGRDSRAPVVCQPKPGQAGIWYRNIGGVLESLSDVYVDDFNLAPTYLPTNLIQYIFDPLLVDDLNPVPEHLRGEVEASFAQQGRFPVNTHLLYKIFYKSAVI